MPTSLQQQILQLAPIPAIQTNHSQSTVSTPVPIQPKPSLKSIAPATGNSSMSSHKQSFQSKVCLNSAPFVLELIVSLFKVNANAFHVQNVEESVQRVNAPPPKRKPSKINQNKNR